MDNIKQANIEYYSEPWAECPYCTYEQHVYEHSENIECDDCGKEFYYTLDI